MTSLALQIFLRQLATAVAEDYDRWHLLSLSEEMRIGRDPRCGIVTDARLFPVVSREHAVIRPLPPTKGDGNADPAGAPATPRNLAIAHPSIDPATLAWELCDLDSANGTYLNGERLWGCQRLFVGDRFQLGQSGPTFCLEYQTPTAPQSWLPGDPHPASQSQVTLSQLFPLLATGGDLARKAYLVPGSITVLVAVSLFLSVGQARWFNGLLATYLGAAAYYFIYRLCGKVKPWWLPVILVLLSMALLSTPILPLFLWFFRDLLPGAIPTLGTTPGFWVLFLRMFIGAGLMEELLKAIPLLLLLAIGRWLPPVQRGHLAILEPLDGIVLGAASALGFTLVETLGQYVPYMAETGIGGQTWGEDGQLAGLQLLIPRLLGSISGHLAYSGYLGYFIGLTVLLPQRRWLILGVGYGTAALLHALWNVMGSYSAFLLAIAGVLSYACLVAAILKARVLSPTRSQNFATQFSQRSR